MTRDKKASPLQAGMPAEGRQRAVIDAVLPVVDNGRFPVKAVAGDPFEVRAHCITDGHDVLRVVLRWRSVDGQAPDPMARRTDEGNVALEEADCEEVEMNLLDNDVWLASFTPPEPGRYAYTVLAWVDRFLSWRHDLARRDDLADIRLALETGAALLDDAARRAKGVDRQSLFEHATLWRNRAVETHADAVDLKALGLDEAVYTLVHIHPDRRLATQWAPEVPMLADRVKARFGNWYEMFPRSAGDTPGEHGTLADVAARLPYIAAMGFDVLYLPPIHPIGRLRRKGKNNATEAGPEDTGSPWAIGAAEGGHKAIHPRLGSMADFQHLQGQAALHGIEIALDIALQCAPDHPYVEAHPEWFRHRPDGSIQYAENPPKRYQDIYPFDFECEPWRELWLELKSIFDFWIDAGVKMFRVDNPHTKSLRFWEWAIGDIKARHPDVLFLSEAFTRPKLMHRLAKLGFSQSYTYFTWRQTATELREYFTELAHGPGQHYFRPNVWPNTPDILHAQFHHAQRPTFALRLLLAATLSSSYGIYGPAFELMANRPLKPGSEEYLDSEKYQLRHWGELSLMRADSLAAFIALVNKIRQARPSLQSMDGLRFHDTDNPQFLAYTRHAPRDPEALLIVANLDTQRVQSGWLSFDPQSVGLPTDAPFEVLDLLTDQTFTWRGGRHFIQLDPFKAPAHVLRIKLHPRGGGAEPLTVH